MKYIKRIIGIFILVGFLAVLKVNAAGTYTMGIAGNNEVNVNSTITLTFNVSNIGSIANGFGGYQGEITYDTAKLTYQSSANLLSGSGWAFYSTPTSGKITFLGYDDNPPSNVKTSNTNIFTVTFKAITTGNTTIDVKQIQGTSGSSVSLTAPDISKTITINAEVAQLSSNNNLSALSVKVGNDTVGLSPTFVKTMQSYSATVPTDITSVEIFATAEDSKATITDGTGIKSLAIGNNSVVVSVKAENNQVKNYTINIERLAPLSSDSSLKGLTVTGHTLLPSFSSTTTSYKMSVPNNVSSITVNAIKSDSGATVNIMGNQNLTAGINNVLIEVTAPNGSKTTYTIEVTKESPSGQTPAPTKSTNNYLKSISGITNYTPVFNKEISNYTLEVPYETTKIDLKAIAEDSKAKVIVTGGETLEVGKVTPITVAVTSESGSVRTYTFNVTRASFESKTSLKDLSIDDATVFPTFDRGTTEYNVTIPGDKTTLNIKAIPEFSDSTVKIIGNKDLKNGSTVLIQVTDKEGITKIYTLNIAKEVKQEKVAGGIMDQYFWLFLLLGIFLLFILILLIIRLMRRNDSDSNKTIIYNNNTSNYDNEYENKDPIKNDEIKEIPASIVTKKIAHTIADDASYEEEYDNIEEDDAMEKLNAWSAVHKEPPVQKKDRVDYTAIKDKITGYGTNLQTFDIDSIKQDDSKEDSTDIDDIKEEIKAEIMMEMGLKKDKKDNAIEEMKEEIKDEIYDSIKKEVMNDIMEKDSYDKRSDEEDEVEFLKKEIINEILETINGKENDKKDLNEELKEAIKKEVLDELSSKYRYFSSMKEEKIRRDSLDIDEIKKQIIESILRNHL